MQKYIVIYHAPAAAIEQMANSTPEQMKEAMKPWMAGAEKIGDSLVDWGTPLAGGQKVTKSGSSPSDREVTGYSILQAENMQAAQALVTGHPHLDWVPGCAIEVHECLPPPM